MQTHTMILRDADQRRPIYTSHEGITLEGITGPYGNFSVAAAIATVIPGGSSGARPMQHPGEELIYLLSGTFEVTVAGTVHTLHPGDSLHFRTQQPHSWRNPGEDDAVAVWMALRPQ